MLPAAPVHDSPIARAAACIVFRALDEIMKTCILTNMKNIIIEHYRHAITVDSHAQRQIHPDAHRHLFESLCPYVENLRHIGVSFERIMLSPIVMSRLSVNV